MRPFVWGGLLLQPRVLRKERGSGVGSWSWAPGSLLCRSFPFSGLGERRRDIDGKEFERKDKIEFEGRVTKFWENCFESSQVVAQKMVAANDLFQVCVS